MENTLQNSKDRLFIKLKSFVVAMMISAQTITGTIVRIPAFKDNFGNCTYNNLCGNNLLQESDYRTSCYVLSLFCNLVVSLFPHFSRK